MYCTNCGYKNADNAKFCQGCGAKLTPGTEKNIASDNNSAETNKIIHNEMSNISEASENNVYNMGNNINADNYTETSYDETFVFSVKKATFRFMATSLKTDVSVKDNLIETNITCKSKLLNKNNKHNKINISEIKSAEFRTASSMAIYDVFLYLVLILASIIMVGEYTVIGSVFFAAALSGVLYWRTLLPSLEITSKAGKKFNIFFDSPEESKSMLRLQSAITKKDYDESTDIKFPFCKKIFGASAIVGVIVLILCLLFSGIAESANDTQRIENIKQSYFANHTDYTVSQLINDKFGDDVEWLIKVDPDGNEYVAAECYMDLEGEDVHIFTMMFASVEENVYKVYQLFVTEESVSTKEMWGFVEALYENTYNLNNGANAYTYPAKADMNAVMVVTPEYTGDKTTVYQLDDNLVAAQQEADAEYQGYIEEMARLEEEARLEELYANALVYTNYGYGLEEPYYPTIYMFEDGTFAFDINQLSHMRTVTGTWSEIWVDGDDISLYFELNSEYWDKNTCFRLFSYDGGYSFTFDGCGENYGSLYGDDIWFYITY